MFDIGCGKGDFLRYIKKMIPEIKPYGIDLAVNTTSDFDFVNGDILRDEINEKFDAICSLAVIEHVDDPGIFVKKIDDLLVPNGLVFITTVNNGGIFYAIARLLNRMGASSAYKRLYSSHHLQHYTNKSLKALMEGNGFKIIAHWNHDYSIKAVDIPSANFLVKKMYLVAVRLIFGLSRLFNAGVLQTITCRKVER